MSYEIASAIIGVVGTLIGAFGGVYYGARLSKEAARHVVVLQARAQFTAAFTGTLVKLRNGVTDRKSVV